MNTIRNVIAAAAVISFSAYIATADTVKMKDGRQFEGTVIQQDDDIVTLQSVKDGITTELKIQMSQVDKVEKKAADNPLGIPRTYVKPPLKVGKYVEIPVVGRFGDQVTAEGMAGTLAKASEDSVEHVVFYVDSQGGDLDATRKIRDLIQSFNGRLKFQAVVRDSVGSAMIIPLLCQNVFIEPGATMGGAMLTFNAKQITPGKTEKIMRSEIAMKAAKGVEKKGINGAVIRAMFDPDYQVCLWLDKKGVLQTTSRKPNEADVGKLIYIADGQKVMTVNRDEAVELGLGKPFDGTIEQLGKELGQEKEWSKVNDTGEQNMQAAADKVREDRLKAASLAEQQARKAEQETKNLVERREQVKSYIANNLAEAAQWDPTKEMMDYTKWAASGDTWGKVSAGYNNIYSDKADAAVMYLYKAYQGVDEMVNLEKQAATLGLKPLYKPGELDDLKSKIQLKGNFLLRQSQNMAQSVKF